MALNPYNYVSNLSPGDPKARCADSRRLRLVFRQDLEAAYLPDWMVCDSRYDLARERIWNVASQMGHEGEGSASNVIASTETVYAAMATILQALPSVDTLRNTQPSHGTTKV